MKYPKNFEIWWRRADTTGLRLERFQWARAKKLAFNAWQAGRRYQQRMREEQLAKNNARVVYYRDGDII